MDKLDFFRDSQVGLLEIFPFEDLVESIVAGENGDRGRF
jgi:hypothetical protein